MAEGGGVRLHVGGLGESVGKDDLLKIFSPMGSVESVEFVRTKGRSFAYIDFSPSSEKSLTKLFSTYNGCVWKGGKLKLEKAKEHYLARLKREWEEESSPSVDTIKASEDSTPSTHLNVYFPRLRKVKALPLSGTGKHKYSFQRVVVPPLLSRTFGDSEEHSTSFTTRENHARDLEALNAGINEEEVNIMNSVMTKLFQKNNIPSSEQVPEKEEVPEEDNESEADQDNLVINVASKGNDMRDAELDIMLRKRKAALNETTASGEGDSQGLKGNNLQSKKKRKSIVQEESRRQEPSPAIREKKKPSKVDLDKTSDEPSKTTDVKQLNDNVSWSQKSSWKALVANGNTNNFSVSSFLPDASSSEAVQPSSPSTDLDGSPISSEDLDAPISTARPMVKTKIKKTKGKHVTSAILADEIERSDTLANADVDSDHSEDSVTDMSVEDPLELVASSDGDSENDDLNVENEDNMAEDSNVEDEDNLENEDSMAEDLNVEDEDNVAEDSNVEDEDNVAEDPNVEDEDNLKNADNMVEDLNVEDEDNVAEYSNVEDEDNVAEDSNMEDEDYVAAESDAEKERLVLKDNVDHDVDKEAGIGQLEASSKSTGGGSTWLQRASWTQLVSEKNTSFSLTELFPDSNTDKPEAARVINNGGGQSSNSNQSESGTKQSQSTNGFEAAGVHVYSTPARSLEETQQTLKVKNASEGCRLAVKKPPIRRNIGSMETCTFMRSATSLREWAKAKKALSEPRRKKKSEE